MSQKLEPCPHCQSLVSAFAELCPKCGANLRRMRNGKFVGIFIAVIGGLILLFFIVAKIENMFK